MKKKLLNQKTLSQFLFSLGLFLLCVNLGWGQVIISATDAATTGDYRSLASGNWSDAGTWQVRTGVATWATASVAPTATNTVYIQAGHTVTLTGESNCYSLHIATTGILTAGANTVNVYGKLRCFTGTAVTLANSDAYLGTDAAPTTTAMLTATAGFTTLRFKGATRNLNYAAEWSASATSPAISIESALDAGTATLSTGTAIKFSNLTVVSGVFVTGNPIVIAGDCIIKTGAKFITTRVGSTSGSLGSSTVGTPAGKLQIDEGGTLDLRTATPTINFATFVNNGTVTYSMSGTPAAGIFMTNANGSSTPDLNTYNNLIINNPSGLTLSGSTTVNGILTLAAGALTNTLGLTLGNSASIVRTAGSLSAVPTFGSTVNVTYNGVAAQNTGNELPTATSVLSNLTINNTAGVTLSGSTTVNGILTLTAGTLTTGANTVTIASTGSVSRTSGWVNGNLKRAIASGANTYLYPLGNATKYTPASLAFTSAGGGDLTGSTVDGVSSSYPVALDAVKKLGRSWNFTTAGIGTFNADITFNYDATDLLGGATSGTITAYKYVSPSTYSYPTTTTGTNSFIATGITGFGEFGAGECGAVTPTFTQVNGICSGGSLSALPTTSNNSITGTWSPALNNTATTLYTFTPTASSCAPTATMTITVNTIPATPLICQLQPFWRSQPVLGPYLQDGINTIEIPNFMLQTDFPYQKRSFAKEVPFADNLSVVRLLGGYSKYPGITGTLTDLTTTDGIALLNQLRAYDFVYRNAGGTLAFRPELIQQRLQPYLDLGYEDLTLVLDNIPWDLTTNTNASINSYGNRGVPNSSQEWFDTVSQLCTTLKSLLGEVKANKLRFRIGTEMNSLERFNGTEAQFITHYDHAAAAIESVLPGATLSLFNISGVTFNNINGVAHNVGAFDVLNHIANENNQKTGVQLTNIPNFVSFSSYFYEDNNLTTVVNNSDQVWDHVNTNIAGYQNTFSREIHEFGGLGDWNAPIPTENDGAFGGAMTLQVFMKYMEVGVDRIYHWNSFRTIPNGPLKYQIPTSQAWIYSVLDYLSGGAVYKITPDTPTITRAATVTSMLSVKNGKSYLLVNSFDPDKTNTTVSEVVVKIPKSSLSSISLASTKMASLTNTNCVLNEIRRDVENANNLNLALVSNPDYIPSNFEDLCIDYTAFKAMVINNATKYENLWKESLTLKSIGGNITEEGTNFVIKLNMAPSQNSVIVFEGPLAKTGTLTANPKTVTTFPNANGKGNTNLTMTSSSAAKVLITHESTGSITTAETIVINNTDLSFTDFPVDYIKDGAIHTFRLYATEAGSSTLGDLLATVIVTGEAQIAPIAIDVATNGDYRSLTSGYWSTPGTWQVRASGSWATATVAPTATNTVYIQAGHNVTLTGESNCYSLHIEKTGILTAGANTVNVYGKLRAYVLTPAVTAASDFYIGADIATTSMVAGMITFTAGYTTLKFKGLARTLVNGNEWSTSATAPAISAEFALNASLAGTFSNGVRFSNLTLSSGNYFMGNIANVITGDFIIKNGAKFQTQATGTTAGSIGNIAGTPAGKLEIEEGGTLAFRTAAPTINFTNFVNNGTVIYVLSAPMSFMTNANGSSTPDVNTYNNITISNLNNNTTGTTLTATSSISIKGILNIVNLTDGTSVSTSILNSDGFVTLKSTATKTATIGTIGTGIINGNVIVERYIPAGHRAYRLLSSPVTTASSIQANWQEGGTGNPFPGFGTHITGTGTGFDTTTSNASSLFTYNSATPAWTASTSTSGTLSAGSPYLIYIRGSRLATNIDGSLTNDATTLRTTGTITIGNVPVTGLNATAGGFSLVGNPYQAQVDMNKVLVANTTAVNLASYYYVVDPKLGLKGAYATVDIGTPASSIAIDANQYLQPGQACFVKTVAAGSASLNFTEADKYEGTQTSVFRTKNTATARLLLTLNDASANALDRLVVVFDASETNDVNHNDASKLTNFDESMATSNSSKLFAIEKRAIPTDTDEIPLNITKYRGTSYSIKAEGSGLTGSTPYLFDQYANKTTEIPQDGSVNYAYSVDVAIPASIAADRFKLIYGKTLKTIDNAVSGFALYPNPSKSDSFSVVVPQTMSKASLTVSNLLGQKLYSQNDLQSGTTVKVNVSNVKTAGVYLVSITSEGKISTTKWIVE